MLSTEQACQWLGLSYESLLRAIRRGDVRGTKVGGKWLVYAELPPPPPESKLPKRTPIFTRKEPGSGS
jgi:excisionase family DNA binding protein